VAGGSVEKEESFMGWLRFLEAIASTGPLIVVFDDLHWSDPSLLEFLEHLVEWSTGVPILVVCTARPELFEKHPAWGAGSRNATTISLSPLSDSEIAQLISALLSQAVLPAEILVALLERAGGNPLYAEEFVTAAQRVRQRLGKRTYCQRVGHAGGISRQHNPANNPTIFRARWLFMKRAGKLSGAEREWLWTVF
jgi:hypothetical protein